MASIVGAYVATLVVFCIIDFAWLGWIAKGFYQGQIGELLLARPNWGAATLFYLLYALGLQIFCIGPALEAASIAKALIYGGLFGVFAYMTYDLSNLATLKGWSVTFAVVDILWGGFVTAVACTAGYLGARSIGH